MKRILFRTLLVAAITGAALWNAFGCQPVNSAQVTPKTATIGIDNFSYKPAKLIVAPGTQVNWVNHDDVPHTVTASDKGFSSPALDTDEHFSRVFSKPGVYSYYCAIHPHMTAQVIVK